MIRVKFLKNYFSFLFKKKEEPLINILTRTSNRPIGFEKCINSVNNQTYRNVRNIISYDDPADLGYIKKHNVDCIRVLREVRGDGNFSDENKFEPYNLYCNELLKEVQEGWIMFLDDDDMLADEKTLENIVANLQNGNDTLIIWKTKFPNGALLPPEWEFKHKQIRFERIDTACFIFHSKYKDVSRWDSWYAADFRFIEGLTKHIPKKKWIPQVFTLKNNFGDRGRRNDLPE